MTCFIFLLHHSSLFYYGIEVVQCFLNGSFLLCSDAEFVGLSLSYGLSLNSVLFWAIFVSCFVENRMVSVERVRQFTNIPSEAPWVIEDCLPSPDWPTQGNVNVHSLEVCDHPSRSVVKFSAIDSSIT